MVVCGCGVVSGVVWWGECGGGGVWVWWCEGGWVVVCVGGVWCVVWGKEKRGVNGAYCVVHDERCIERA